MQIKFRLFPKESQNKLVIYNLTRLEKIITTKLVKVYWHYI